MPCYLFLSPIPSLVAELMAWCVLVSLFYFSLHLFSSMIVKSGLPVWLSSRMSLKSCVANCPFCALNGFRDNILPGQKRKEGISLKVTPDDFICSSREFLIGKGTGHIHTCAGIYTGKKKEAAKET